MRPLWSTAFGFNPPSLPTQPLFRGPWWSEGDFSTPNLTECHFGINFFPTSRPTIVLVSVFWKRTENLATVKERYIIILCAWRFHFPLFIYFFIALRRCLACQAAFLVRQTWYSARWGSDSRTFRSPETLTWWNRYSRLIFHSDWFFLFHLGKRSET